MHNERVFGHLIDVMGFSERSASGTAHPEENPCDSTPCATLVLAAKLEKAMKTVSSTIAAGPRLFSNSLRAHPSR